MEKVFGISSKFFAVGSALLLSGFVFTSCDKNDNDNDNNSNRFTLSGNANGSQMVPSVTTNGTATMTGTYDASTNTMVYTTNWNNMSGAPTSGGFYTGSSGVAGTAAGSSWSMGSGLSSSGTFSGQTVLTDAQETDMRNGNYYYSMGTSSNVNGEIRGQMTATQVQ